MSDAIDGDGGVFGVPRERIARAIGGAIGAEVVAYTIDVRHAVTGYTGYQADKVIPTFEYTTVHGGAGSLTMLVKRFYTPGEREASHYHHLGEHGAPIPQLYLAAADGEGREVLFLEFLEAIPDLDPMAGFLADAGNFHRFLTGAARLNAVRPSPAYAGVLRPRHLGGSLAESRDSLARVWGLAEGGSLGEELRAYAASESPERLVALSRRLETAVADMPVGVVHNDYHTANAGVRHATGELLAFDLEFVGIGPRFTDIAEWLGESDEECPRPLPRADLASRYIEVYVAAGGDAPTPGTLLAEATALLMTRSLRMLGWSLGRAMDGEVDWTDDRTEGRREARGGLLTDVRRLARYATDPDLPPVP